MATLRKYDPDQPRDDHGEWTAGGGGGGPSLRDRMRPGGDPHAKATESLKDPAFVAQHADRISRAGDEARLNFPGREATDEAHGAALAHIHGEAARIHAEEEAHGGDAALRAQGRDAHDLARSRGEDSVAQHEAALSAIHDAKVEQATAASERANEDRAIAAGHVTTEARDIVDAYAAEHAGLTKEAEAHAAALEEAHREAAAALGSLHAYEHEEDEHAGIAAFELEHTHDLADQFDATHLALEEEGLKATGSLSDVHDKHHDAAPDAPEHAPHPDSSDYDFTHPHPDDHEFQNHHPDSGFGPEPVHPHPDDVDEELTHDQHQQMLAAHTAERESGISAHDAEHAAVLASHEQERAAVLAAHEDYKSKMAERAQEQARRAETAQSALEKLHETQVAAVSGLKRITSESDRAGTAAQKQIDRMAEDRHVNHDAFAGHARDAEGEITDSTAAQVYEAAHEASSSMLAHASSRLDEYQHLDFGESINALKDEMKSTAQAIRELSKHTGRAARLAGKTKKSVGDASENLVVGVCFVLEV